MKLGAHRNYPFFAIATNAGPVVVSKLCRAFLVWTYYLPCQLPILYKELHPFHLEKLVLVAYYTNISTYRFDKIPGALWVHQDGRTYTGFVESLRCDLEWRHRCHG